MFVFADQRFGRPNLAVVQPVILRQFDLRLKPELRFPVCVMHMHVEPRFLAGEEKEPESILAKDCRAQGLSFRALNATLTGRRRAKRDRNQTALRLGAPVERLVGQRFHLHELASLKRRHISRL